MGFLNRKESDLSSHFSTKSTRRSSGVFTVTGSGEHRAARSGEHAVADASVGRTTDLPPITFEPQSTDEAAPPLKKKSIFGL